jgi:hypothetical protein
VVILELIHALKVLTFMGGMQLLDTKPTRATGFLVIHDNFANRIALCWRWVIQISALSTFDGRIEAYRGDNG